MDGLHLACRTRLTFNTATLTNTAQRERVFGTEETESKCKTTALLQYTGFSLFCCTHCLPGTSSQEGQAGTRIQLMCRGVGGEVIIHEPAYTQAGHALVQSSLSAVLI